MYALMYKWMNICLIIGPVGPNMFNACIKWAKWVVCVRHTRLSMVNIIFKLKIIKERVTKKNTSFVSRTRI